MEESRTVVDVEKDVEEDVEGVKSLIGTTMGLTLWLAPQRYLLLFII